MAPEAHQHDDDQPRCILCGVAEEDQDRVFEEYPDDNGISYLCLMCIESY